MVHLVLVRPASLGLLHELLAERYIASHLVDVIQWCYINLIIVIIIIIIINVIFHSDCCKYRYYICFDRLK